jgi:hypothetical protein
VNAIVRVTIASLVSASDAISSVEKPDARHSHDRFGERRYFAASSTTRVHAVE